MEDRSPFVKLSFAGARFKGARLPADASVNISIYESILIELAKQIWREENPNRLKLPKNFAKYFQLQLGQISEGSAVAELPRFQEDLPPLFGSLAPGDIFDKAQDKLVSIIDAANDNQPIPYLCPSLRSELNQLRKNMRDTEDLIVTRGRLKRDHDFHRISLSTKERITTEIREERSKHITGFGILSGISVTPPTISVISEHGPIEFELNFQTIKETYQQHAGRIVDFNILATVDYDGKIKRVDAVNSVELVEDSKAMAEAVNRTKNLGGLEEGWLDGEGEEISKITIYAATDISRFLASFDETIAIFPTLDGNISIEYERSDLEWTVTIRDQAVLVEVTDLDTDESLARRFKGASSNLLKMLLSENGHLDE